MIDFIVSKGWHATRETEPLMADAVRTTSKFGDLFCFMALLGLPWSSGRARGIARLGCQWEGVNRR